MCLYTPHTVGENFVLAGSCQVGCIVYLIVGNIRIEGYQDMRLVQKVLRIYIICRANEESPRKCLLVRVEQYNDWNY